MRAGRPRPLSNPPAHLPASHPRKRRGSRYAVRSGVRKRARHLRPPGRRRVHVRRDRRELGERGDRGALLCGHRRVGRLQRAGDDAGGDGADPRARATGGGGGARRSERLLPRLRGRRAAGRPRDPPGGDAGRAPGPARGARRARPLATLVREPLHQPLGSQAGRDARALRRHARRAQPPPVPGAARGGARALRDPPSVARLRGCRHLRGHLEDARHEARVASGARVAGTEDAADWVRERARELGEEGGFEYAEGFKTFDLRDEDVDIAEPV